jgi:hypothetical protein
MAISKKEKPSKFEAFHIFFLTKSIIEDTFEFVLVTKWQKLAYTTPQNDCIHIDVSYLLLVGCTHMFHVHLEF